MINHSNKGQSLTELLVVVSGLLILTIPICRSWIFEWKKLRCAYWVFESAHAKLMGRDDGRPIFSHAVGVRVIETSNQIIGEGRCAGGLEKVNLVKLEYAAW